MLQELSVIALQNDIIFLYSRKRCSEIWFVEVITWCIVIYLLELQQFAPFVLLMCTFTWHKLHTTQHVCACMCYEYLGRFSPSKAAFKQNFVLIILNLFLGIFY